MRITIFIILFVQTAISSFGQICGTPGFDGSGNITASVNTYYPIAGNVTLESGLARTVTLAAVPLDDPYGNNFGNMSINAGDMLLIIQMQDATIQASDNNLYGSGSFPSAPDNLGGSGFTLLGNTGVFEYAVATNAVPLTGGVLTFRASGLANGTVNTFYNEAATASRGKRTFQVVRIPQYSNLVLSSDIKTPPFNGVAGGIIAFDVAGSMNFNGHTIDASARGFRGGFGPVFNSGGNISSLYMIPSSDFRSVGKGEGIAGTPRYMWDGYNQVDNATEGLPGGSYGKGAPGNAGGGGNDHNSGGGGGGNGGYGGVGGNGTATVISPPNTFPNGGRPGAITYSSAPDISRIIMGGGGGGGDANDALNGVKGGVGGGVILINVGRIIGKGTILANGGEGAAGAQGSQPDGAGGGGAGGTVYIKVTNPDPLAMLIIEAKGGNGGNTRNDPGSNEHGPGGGGGGGVIFYTTPPATVDLKVNKGNSGKTDSGAGSSHGASSGKDGVEVPFLISDLPAYLQGGGSGCFPSVTTVISDVNPGVNVYRGMEIVYTIKATNNGGANAGGVRIETLLPAGISFKKADVNYTGDSGGPAIISNLVTSAQRPLLGDFNISPGHDVIITLTAQVDCATLPGTYHANAQTLYFDPSRTILDPDRRITAIVNAFTGSETEYETIAGATVPGSNFNGSSSLDDNVIVAAAPTLDGNTISIVGNPVKFCTVNIGDFADPDIISGSDPVGDIGIYTFQWQTSSDNISYTDIAGATDKNYNPPPINATAYFRRVVQSSLCTPPINSNSIKVLIAVAPVADFDMPDFCLDDGTAEFINKSTIADGSQSQLTYLWDFGESSATSTAIDGSYDYTTTGVFTVSLTVTSKDGCTSTKSAQFTVNGSNPIAAFVVKNVDKLCNSTPVYFEDRATVTPGEITRIEWYYDYDNFPAQVEIDEEPGLRTAPKTYQHVYSVFTGPSKNFTVLMKAFSGESCVSEISETITVYASPVVEFNSMFDVCFSDNEFQITAASEIAGVTGTGKYSGFGVSSSGWFNPSLAGVGTHVITYTFEAVAGGCVDSKSRSITVLENPRAESETVEVLLGGSVELPSIAEEGLVYNWSPSLNLSRPDILNPVASPIETTTYTLTVTNNITNCSGQGTVHVIVHGIPKIPNTFTPNGDGINDYWIITNINTYTDCTVKIFNRFGGEVFHSKGYASPWDGRFNGTPLPVGTYYYLIDPKKGRDILSGSITILK